MDRLTIINETSLPVSLDFRNRTELHWAKAIAKALPNQQSFFNVSKKDHVLIYILILLLKNTFVCYGVSNLISKYFTVLLLAALTCFVLIFSEYSFTKELIFSEYSYTQELVFIWGFWLNVLYISHNFMNTMPTGSYCLSVFCLAAVPLAYSPHISEFVIDVFCGVNLTFYIFQVMLKPYGVILQRLVLGMMAIFVFKSVDTLFEASGRIFDLGILTTIIAVIVTDAVRRRQNLLVVELMVIACTCLCGRLAFRNITTTD